MRTRNNVLILDTETVGTFKSPLVHDFGYVVIDKSFNVLTKGRFLVKELHEDAQWILNSSDFYCRYSKDYENARQVETVLPWHEISGQMVKIINDYKVSTISAYNLQFDYKAIEYTDKMFNHQKKTLSSVLHQKSKNLLCIYNLACDTILQSATYHEFAAENGLYTEKGNISTNAENAYRYIMNNTAYVEKHTALSDALDEMQILKYIVKNVKKKTPDYGLFYNCWQKAQA